MHTLHFQAARSREREKRPRHRTADHGSRCGTGADRKKQLEPSQRKEAVRALEDCGLSRIRACTIVGQPPDPVLSHEAKTARRGADRKYANAGSGTAALRLAPADYYGSSQYGRSRRIAISSYLSTARSSGAATQETQGALCSRNQPLNGRSTR